MDLKLKDKVVLVTGGTGGIGTAIVKGFLAEGAKVAFSSTSQAKIDALIPQLGACDCKVAGFVADMNNEEDIKNFVENAKKRFGTIDIVVPNAGYEGKAHPVQDTKRRAQAVVDYLTQKGYDVDRLVAKGYGESKPVVVTEEIAKMDSLFVVGMELSPSIIEKFPKASQEKANQINRRTELRILSTDYIPKPEYFVRQKRKMGRN